MPAFKGLEEIQNAVNLEFSSNEFLTNSKHIVFFIGQLVSKILDALFPSWLGCIIQKWKRY